MTRQVCPECGQEFEAPANVELLLRCPQCAARSAIVGQASVTIMTLDSDRKPVPVAEIPLAEDFLARYERGRVLGAGGSGTVYLARDRASGRQIAIKFLTARHNATSRKRFEREMALLTKLRHEHIVEVLEAGEMSGYPYLVTEYLNGGTLTTRIRAHGRLPPTEAVRVMKDILAGLSLCHEHGIIHRDLKPDNVLFSSAGRAKVTDLGLAKDQNAPDPSFTSPTAICGTPHYISPEQIKGASVGPSADVYSCGVVLYEMLFGEPPFHADSVWQLLDHHVHTEPTPLLERVPYVPEPLAAAVHRALSKDASARFPSAREFLAALDSCGL